MGWRKKKRKVSYWFEMLKHRFNVKAFLGALGISVFLSIPYGGAGFLPFLGYLGVLTIASLVVPDHHRWKEAVDRRIREEQREATREHLVSEIRFRVADDHTYWKTYERMLSRRQALAKMAADSETAISLDDITGLDECTVDYLGVWLARIAIHERAQAVDKKSLRGTIAHMDAQLEGDLPAADRRRFQKAKGDISKLLRRHEEMRSRDAVLETNMLSMADTFDEVYQRIVANPTSRENVANELKVAVEQMNAEEEIGYELEDEIEALLEH